MGAWGAGGGDRAAQPNKKVIIQLGKNDIVGSNGSSVLWGGGHMTRSIVFSTVLGTDLQHSEIRRLLTICSTSSNSEDRPGTTYVP